MLHQCWNCHECFAEEQLRYPPNLFELMEPGDNLPSGACPDCGMLCYPVEGEGLIAVDSWDDPVWNEIRVTVAGPI
jgi:hypothetical protein